MLNFEIPKLLFSALIFILWMSIPAPLYSSEIDPQKLLEAVDDNLWSNTKRINGRLIIDNGRKERVLTWEHWMEGVDKAYTHSHGDQEREAARDRTQHLPRLHHGRDGCGA